MATLTPSDFAPAIYSSGKVFDGLRTGRTATENFLWSGNLDGVTSRADLALLEDLRDVAQLVIDRAGETVDAAYVRSVNGLLTRNAALRPGRLRTADQHIGVQTRHGRHTPDALTEQQLQDIVMGATGGDDVREDALDLFVSLARAQPFEDGNKRTALFVANSLLIGDRLLLVVPFDEDDPGVADSFNDLLARAYVFNDDDGVKATMRARGFVALRNPG